jgi:folate-binding protein YgfZ
LKTEEDVTRVRKGAAWICLDHLSLIRVGGPNRVKFLHNLLSNDIAGLVAGQSRLAALMNLKGQQVAWMRVMAEADALICELPKAVRNTVVDTFLHYKVGAPVRFEKPEATVFGLFGDKAVQTLAALGVDAPPTSIETFSSAAGFGGTMRISRGRDLPASGFTIHVDATASAATEEKLRGLLGEPLNNATLDTLRVEEGIPWHGFDVKEENLLHETGQLGIYHSPSKGCYLGQEVVARLEGRGGNVNKRLVGLKAAAPIPADHDIVAEKKVIGRVTSGGISPEFGPIAMGYVHRSHAEPGQHVRIGEVEAETTLLPFRS